MIALQYPYEQKKYLWNKIAVHSLRGKNSKVKKPFVWMNAFRIASAINKLHPVSIVHSLWLGECAFIGNILASKFNCEHVCTLMGQDVTAGNKYLTLTNKRRIKIVALSKNQADQFFHLTKTKPGEIIHLGINDQNFSYTERDIDFLGVGSLIPLKNYSLFIKLIIELKKIKPEINCKLVGSGPQLSQLRSLAEEKDILNNIEFTGMLSRTEIFKLMQKSRILVHPSTFESFGYVFAEALVNGMNILSFNVGDARKHPKWFIAKDEEDFINIGRELILSELDFNPINIFPMNDTISKYASLYGIN